jgi:hypothetical protein
MQSNLASKILEKDSILLPAHVSGSEFILNFVIRKSDATTVAH